MPIRVFNKTKSLPLQLVLSVPFVLQIFGAVGLVGYFSFKNGHKAVSDLAGQLMQRTSSIVNQHLDAYLSVPLKVIQTNADTIQIRLLNVQDRKTASKYFWKQMQSYDLTYIGIGLTTGAGAGAGRYDGKTVVIDDWDGQPPHKITSYATDKQGNRTTVLTQYEWDNFKEDWYKEPIRLRRPVWTRIYSINYPNYPYIVASVGQPIYDTNNQLLGMVAADIHLLKLSDFLRNLDVSRSGQVFIMERNGMLIASSSKQQPFTFVKDEIKRLKAVESPDPVVQGVAKQLQQRFNHNLQSIQQVQELELDLQGTDHFVQVTPWQDRYGLDWLVVVSVPKSEFMAQINANTRTTVLLCLAALGIATVLVCITSRWMTGLISRLNQASRAIADGDLNQNVEPSGIQELDSLATSFNHMGSQLRESFTALEQTNEALEDRVEARTLELKNTLNELQRTQAQVVQSEKMSSLGQLVAGVAHEINNPINFIHGNLDHVQEYTQDLLNFVHLYQKHCPNPPTIVQNEAEVIDLEFIQEDLPKTLGSMQVGTERIRQIVLSLRNFSRMDEAEFKAVDIHGGIDSTLMILQHRLKARAERPEIQVIKHYEKLPQVECFAGQLNQVFMNILSNAIDALEELNIGKSYQVIDTNPNCITIHTAMLGNDMVEITISDNGPGMSEEVQKSIFNPFFTTKPIGKGTGMGMSISYQIVTEKHNGSLTCASIPGQGTEFRICIPVRQNVLEVA